ncbi:hypothetical protein M5689_009889 [Euphorbia peplus]|nr:hypothetical protein M5689_009889 [Euphorbia peplus]
MGNCMNVLCNKNAEKSSRVIFYNGKVKQFKPSTPVKNIISGRYRGCSVGHHSSPFSPLPLDTELKAGEIYHLMPPHCSLKKCSPELLNQKQKIKIVVTIDQLEKLLGSNGIEVKSGGVTLEFSESFRRKWLPSLSSIQEEQQF